jgi:hypothetical protein
MASFSFQKPIAIDIGSAIPLCTAFYHVFA